MGMARRLRTVSMGERITIANLGVNRSQNMPNKNHAIILILREICSLLFAKTQANANDKVNVQARIFVTHIGETIDSNICHWLDFLRRILLRYSP